MQPIFFLGKLKMWNVKMQWILGFSISKIFCIWVFNRLDKNIEGCFKCFLTSISHSDPILTKSSYGWLSLLATSQNWTKIKHTPLLFVPMTKEGCIFFCFGMDLLGPHYDQSNQVIELWDELQFSFSPFKANTNLRTTSINKP
jgi:hypothetical protein